MQSWPCKTAHEQYNSSDSELKKEISDNMHSQPRIGAFVSQLLAAAKAQMVLPSLPAVSVDGIRRRLGRQGRSQPR